MNALTKLFSRGPNRHQRRAQAQRVRTAPARERMAAMLRNRTDQARIRRFAVRRKAALTHARAVLRRSPTKRSLLSRVLAVLA